jgi:hypothetical protein
MYIDPGYMMCSTTFDKKSLSVSYANKLRRKNWSAAMIGRDGT